MGETFYRWLQGQTDRDDVVGDIARDVMRDESAPKLYNTFDRWFRYVSAKSHSEDVLEALGDAWKEFRPQDEEIVNETLNELYDEE